MEPTTPTTAGLTRRGSKLILAGVLALAMIGYVVGLRAGVPDGPPGLTSTPTSTMPSSPVAESDVRAAMTYNEIGAGGLRAGSASQAWSDMVTALRMAPGKPTTDMANREASLALRATRRAFNGAPPTIPHDTRGVSNQACLACHGESLKIGAGVARALPHPHMAHCTQCHVPSAPAFLASEGGVLSESSWRGLPTPKAGVRAAPGAPPGIPHSTHMRNNCLACHGPTGWPGVQTTHPERRACMQCHAWISNQDHPGLGQSAPTLLPPLKRSDR